MSVNDHLAAVEPGLVLGILIPPVMPLAPVLVALIPPTNHEIEVGFMLAAPNKCRSVTGD